MRFQNSLLLLLVSACSAVCSVCAQAEPTPVGAEIEGKPSQGIPAWTGGLREAPAGFDKAAGFKDPFEADEPLFSITNANVAQHARLLTPGQLALFKRFPDYRVAVYPTRRSAAFSDAYYKAIAAEAGTVRLIKEGKAISGHARSSVPFPKPENGLEAVWNVLLRRPADSVESASASFVLADSASPKPVVSAEKIAWAPHFASLPNATDWVFLIGEIIKPSSMAGDALLVNESTDHQDAPRRSWTINSGQRRVVRLPELAFDAPAGNSDALRTVDDVSGFNGSPERFDWKLLGKQDMLIPYNNYRLTRKQLKYNQLYKGLLQDPTLVRHEVHRVWVLEAQLKPSARHVYSKRVYYIDEDSWSIALVDAYDTRGELWRTRMMYLFQAYTAPGMFSAGEVQHDFQVRKSLFTGFQNEEKPVEFNKKLSPSDFTIDALRRMIR